jgi:hydroxyacylglutathione hydrolase
MRLVKGVLFLLLVLVILAAIGLVVLRMTRSRVGEVTTVKPNIVEVPNGAGIDVFAAKVGPRVIFFDTGIDPEGHPVDAALSALGADRNAVSDVFLTHSHMDHLAGASQLPKAKLHLGAADVPVAEGKAAPEATIPRLLAKVVGAPPLAITDPLRGAESFDVGEGKTVKAYPVPGHTPGSFAFLYDGVAFVGDIMVFKQGQLELSPAMLSTSPEENKASIRALKTQLANETFDTVCTAHGGCTPKGFGKNLLDELAAKI